MEAVLKPTNVYFDDLSETEGTLIVSPCYPGYGTTIGNAMRRVLLSSIPGSAVTRVKVKGVEHEFSTIDGVKEDMIDIILNLKQAHFIVHTDEPVKISAKKSGKGNLTLADFKGNSDAEIVNGDLVVATLSDTKAEVEMELTVERGLGYMLVEAGEKEKMSLGEIAIDRVYTPIKNVSFRVENVRVGQRTDFDKVTLKITTDGSITPKEAVEAAARILVEQFSVLRAIEESVVEAETEEDIMDDVKLSEDSGDSTEDALEGAGFSTRTMNALHTEGFKTLSELTEKTADELLELNGFGKTSLEEVKKALGDKGLSLKK